MSKKNSLCLLFIVLTAVVNPLKSFSQSFKQEQIKSQLDAIFQPLVDARQPLSKRLVGVSVGVMTPDGGLARGYGSLTRRRNKKPDGETIYEIASITKTFTALLLARQIIEGKISLNTPVTNCRPNKTNAYCYRGDPVTFGDLATHSSGLPLRPSNLDTSKPHPYGAYTKGMLGQFLREFWLDDTPGRKFVYSNVGYSLMAELLARRDGFKNLEEAYTKKIIKPLGMKSTGIRLHKAKSHRLAPGHFRGRLTPQRNDQGGMSGSGALHSSVNDLLIYLQAQISPRPGQLGEAIGLTQFPHRTIEVNDRENVGLAWRIFRRSSVVWHGGSTLGYRSFVAFHRRKGLGVVVLSNTQPAPNPVIENAGFAVLKFLFKKY